MPTNTLHPSSMANVTTLSRYFGALWAEATLTSCEIPNSDSTAEHLSATCRSDLDPSRMQTSMHCRVVVGSNACRLSTVLLLGIEGEKPLWPLQSHVDHRGFRQGACGESIAHRTDVERIVHKTGPVD